MKHLFKQDAVSISPWSCSDIFYAFPPPPSGQNTFFWEEDGKKVAGGEKKIKERWMTGGRKWRRETHQRGEVSLEAEGR